MDVVIALSNQLFLSLFLPLLLLGTIFLYTLHKSQHYNNHNSKDAAPRVSKPWPIIGHLHLLTRQEPLARTLGSLADKYGPIFTFKLGMDRALVVSNADALRECFTINDKNFATRPPTSASKYLGYNFAAFTFSPYGPYWREMRKMVQLQVLSSKRIEALMNVRISELNSSIQELYSYIKKTNKQGHVGSNDREALGHGDIFPVKVDVSQWIEQLTLNAIVKTISGKRNVNLLDESDVEEDETSKNFRRVIREFMYVSGQFVVSDNIRLPLLSWLDIGGHVKSMKRIASELDVIIQSWIDEHIETRRQLGRENDHDGQDFIDVLLSQIDDKISFGHPRDTIIKGTIMSIIIAGADTTSILLTWIMSLLINNPHVMKQLQEEIHTKIGTDRWVEESDINNLPYLQSIFKETLRLYPPAPLSVPHEAMEDCIVGGYKIEKGTRLFVNLWKLHRDPRVWSDPDQFKPERFLEKHAEVDVFGHQFEYTPFGAGRRSCPGTAFAIKVANLTIARLVQGFEFSTMLDLPVDMDEGLGITLPRKNSLQLLMKPLLNNSIYTSL
ncbi:oxygenase [Lithospermum erythrorhizon]|uniref:Oxygenase n=1 Tax=Lithospermum erythrorhizon TaxID=34254 RepID=A0AAV3RAL2_LITER